MKGRALLLSLTLAAAAWIAGAPQVVAASTPAPAAAKSQEPTADQIVEQYIAARGGIKKIRAIRTLRESGRMTEGPNREAVVTRELKRPAHTRFEITLQGVTGVFVSDGTKGWKLNPFDGDLEPKPLPEAAIKEAAEQADIEGPLVDWKAKGHALELLGKDTVGDRVAWKIRMTLKSGDVRYEYIDVKNYERLRTDSTRTVKGRPVQVQVIFGDYKKTAGVSFPGVVEVTASGRPQKLRITVEKVEVNPALADDRFAMLAPTAP